VQSPLQDDKKSDFGDITDFRHDTKSFANKNPEI
jgi:hypothetical protein